VAIGKQAKVDDFAIHGVALGHDTLVLQNAEYGVALGAGARLWIGTPVEAIAIGRRADARHERTIAIGSYAEARGVECIALGRSSYCEGSNSIAIGRSARSLAANSIVLSASGSGLNPNAAGLYVDAIVEKTTAGSLGLYYDSTTNEVYAAPEQTRRRLQEDDDARIAALEAEVVELKRLLKEHLSL
jgi:hypothetical protein